MTQPNIAYLKLDELARLYAENRYDREQAKKRWTDCGESDDRIAHRKRTLCQMLEELESNLRHSKMAYDSGDIRMSAAALKEAMRNLKNITDQESGVQSIPGPYSLMDQAWMFHQPVMYAKILQTARSTINIPPSIQWLFKKD